jgi:hypothetical protein
MQTPPSSPSYPSSSEFYVETTEDAGISDDILSEDIESGRLVVSAVAEQFHVERAAESLMNLILDTEDLVKPFVASSSPIKIISRLSLSLKESPDLKTLARTSHAALQDTMLRVQEVHMATLQRQVKRSVSLGALNYIQRIIQCVSRADNLLAPWTGR